MNPDTKKRSIHSPYVVVLGGDKVRKKPAPTQLFPREKPEQHVFGVLPPVKTMAQDLAEAKEHAQVVKPTSRFKSFFSKKEKRQNTEALKATRVVSSIKPIAPPILPPQRSPQKIEQQSSIKEHTAVSPYRSHFQRGIEKKGYLKSKLAVQLPKHAKVGAGLAILAILIAAPLLSTVFSRTGPPITAKTIVTQGTEALVAQVGKAIELPLGETPLVVIATADDIRRLNVSDAKPGDKILIYQEAGKIVVYDAEEDKVLGVVNRARP